MRTLHLTHLTQLALLCASLLACSSSAWRGADDGGTRADAAWRSGRDHHLAQRLDAARAAYHAALQAEPGHPGARNGLAALHADRRELDAAIAIWRDLTASVRADAGPGKAYLFSNLGRAYLLRGEHRGALAALERACLLDPLDARAWELLGQTLEALGDAPRAQRMRRQAAALRRHDLRADFAAAGATTTVAPLGQALRAPAPAEHPGWSRDWIDTGADGMMALRREVLAQDVMEKAESMEAYAGPARLEIRNGNGVTGMARALARRIAAPGMQVTRLSNAPGFAVRQTRIEYVAGHAAAARRLARRLGSVELREAGPQAAVDLRLVLGRDLAATPVLFAQR